MKKSGAQPQPYPCLAFDHKSSGSMAIEIMLCFLNPGLLYFFHIIRAVSNDGIILRVAEDKFMIAEGIWDPSYIPAEL